MSARKLAAYLTLSWVPHALAYVVAPNAIGAAGTRFDASVGLGAWSIAGVPLLISGGGLIGWAISSHYRASPDELQATARPTYLVTTGAYAVSRNPLYLGGALLWLGWAVTWLSAAIVIGAVVLFGFLASVGVPYEERVLRHLHGTDYDAYCRSVGRWLQRHPGHGAQQERRGAADR